jgi:serine/threonine protein kinase
MSNELVARAIAAIQARCFDHALALCEQALQVDASAEGALAYRAVAFARLGRVIDAESAARYCLRLYPDNAFVRDLLRQVSAAASAAYASTIDPCDWRMGRVVHDRWEIFGGASGGMGRVYFARDHAWGGMELAIKSLSRDRDNDLARKLFRRETRVWLDLGSHPNIVSGYYTVELDGQLRFFMEYVEGESLSDLAAGRPMPLARALDLAIQLAAGMVYVHAKCVVHRDLKPDNCMVAAGDLVKITDFGLGCSLSQLDAGTGTLRGTDYLLDRGPAGTPLYMAPEQWRTLRDATAAADVYAFGALVHELLCGEPPFVPTLAWMGRFLPAQPLAVRRELADERDLRQVVRILHAAGEVVPLQERGVRVPRPIDTLIKRCLAKNPEVRPPFSRLLCDLRDLYELTTGKPYEREIVGALEPTEAAENNRAVSYHVMGKTDEARTIVDNWLATHPMALYPWINRAVMQIEAGEASPADVASGMHRDVRAVHAAVFDSDPAVVALARGLAPWLLRAGSPATALALAFDGRTLAAGYADGRIVVWDTSRGERVRELRGHEHRIAALEYNRDGTIVSGSWDHTVRLWHDDTATVLSGSREWVLAVHAVGDAVVAGAADGSLRVWHRAQPKLPTVVPAHDDAVDVVFGDNGLIVSAGRDACLRVWRLTDTRLSPFAKVDVGHAVTCALAVRGGRFITASPEGMLTCFTVGLRVWEVELPAPAIALGADVRGRVLAASAAGRLLAVNVETGATTSLLVPADIAARTAAISAVAEEAWFGRDDGTIWRATSGSIPQPRLAFAIRQPRAASEQAQLQRACDALFARLGDSDLAAHAELQALRTRAPELQRDLRVVTALHEAGARSGIRRGVRDVWSAWQLDTGAAITAIAIAADEHTAWVGTRNGTVIGVDVETGTPGRPLFMPGISRERVPIVSMVAVDGGAVAGLADGTLTRIANDAIAWQIVAHRRSPLGLAGLPGAIVTAGDDTLCAWRLDTGELVKRVEVAAVCGAVAGVDPNTVFTLAPGRAVVWDAHLVPMCSHALPGRSVAARATSMGIVVRTTASTCVLVDRDGATRSTIPGATSAALCGVAVTADARFVATASRDFNDHKLHMWDGDTGVELRAIDHGAPVRELAFARDGLRLITGDDRGLVRAWTLDTRWEMP